MKSDRLGQATPEQRDACVKLYRKILKTLDGEDFDTITNTLVFVLADVVTDVDDLPKKEFIATVVEQLSGAWDMCVLHKADTEGGTQ